MILAHLDFISPYIGLTFEPLISHLAQWLDSECQGAWFIFSNPNEQLLYYICICCRILRIQYRIYTIYLRWQLQPQKLIISYPGFFGPYHPASIYIGTRACSKRRPSYIFIGKILRCCISVTDAKKRVNLPMLSGLVQNLGGFQFSKPQPCKTTNALDEGNVKMYDNC